MNLFLFAVDKMKMIDEEYEALRYKGDKWVSYEAKLTAYRKDIEAQVQAEMNAKVCNLLLKVCIHYHVPEYILW